MDAKGLPADGRFVLGAEIPTHVLHCQLSDRRASYARSISNHAAITSTTLPPTNLSLNFEPFALSLSLSLTVLFGDDEVGHGRRRSC